MTNDPAVLERNFHNTESLPLPAKILASDEMQYLKRRDQKEEGYGKHGKKL